jgi:hypothetical protein
MNNRPGFYGMFCRAGWCDPQILTAAFSRYS